MKFPALLGCLTALAICWAGAAAGKERKLVVFAAASTKEVVEALSSAFKNQCQCRIQVSFGGTGALARQIAAGAPADIFISADVKWMDWLQTKSKRLAGKPVTVATNSLVVTTRENGEKKPLSDALSQRFAMGEPESVPAGRYARQALAFQNLWLEAKSRAVFTENVRVALSMVARGAVDAAIVYRSDAALVDGLQIRHSFPTNSHDKIRYQAVRVDNKNPIGEDFFKFLSTALAKKEFSRFGFEPVE